jgi:hypothetical protein
MSAQGRQGRELTVGIVGSSELVQRIVLAGLPAAADRSWPLSADRGLPARGGTDRHPAADRGWDRTWAADNGAPAERLPAADRGRADRHPRIVTAAYRTESEAAEKAARLAPVADAVLFGSRAAYEFASQETTLPCPATYIKLGGSSLYAALQRAVRAGQDLARCSFDGLVRGEVETALAELEITGAEPQVHEQAATATAITAFHQRLHADGRTTAAFTCMESVADRLEPTGVPVFLVRPTVSAILAGLRISALLAENRALWQAQLAVIVVEVPGWRDSARRMAPWHAREELRLTVHRFLVREAQRMQAAVSPQGEHAFLVTTTRGALATAPDGPDELPFARRARAELGIGLDVAIGTGQTAAEAEARARAMLGRYAPTPRLSGQQAGHGQPNVPRPRTAQPAAPPRGMATLARLAQQLPAGATPVVDAELTAKVLAVTPRTARRQLRALVDDGLAWPLPPTSGQQPGRPRQAYRLVIERLEPDGGARGAVPPGQHSNAG